MVNFNLSMNFPAVFVSALVTFALGGIWYSPILFAKQWVAAHGFTPEQLERMQKGAIRAYATSFLCWLMMAAVLGILINRIGVNTALGGGKLGVLCWVGFAAPIGVSSHGFSERKIGVLLIDAGYQLVSLAVMGVILSIWQ